jgi:hypothetical protein
MRLIVSVLSVFLGYSVAQANPRVTENTDINKRDVKSHHQVTRCEGGSCKINTITEFDKPVKGKHIYYGDCNYAEEGTRRFSECQLSKKKKSSKVIVKEKVVDNTKKNRIQLHLGMGPSGFKVDEDPNDTGVKSDTKPIVGLQYTRKLNNRWNVGVSGFSNKAGTLSIGLDY